MSDAMVIVLFVVFSVAVLALVRLAPKIASAVTRLLSGEPGSLMAGGFVPRGTRIRRTVELQAVVSRLGLITRLNLPLCQALDAAAAGETRRIRRVLREMSRLIRTGIPASAALEAAFPGCPVQLPATLRRAEACGQLTQALADQERMIAATIDVHLKSTAHTRHAMDYAAFMTLFAGSMVLWIMAFLMPKYREIFKDYDVRLPKTTLALLEVTSWFAAHWGAVGIGVLLIVGGLGLLFLCTRKTGETGILARMVATVRWAFPITRTLDYGLGMAKAIRSMMLGIRSGAPGAFAATLPSVISPTNHLRPRLAILTSRILEGVAPHKAAQDAKLGDVLVSALRMVERGDDPERVLGHAADYYEAVAYRWWHALAALTGPLVTLAMGVMVGFIALALFLPLIALIDSVSEAI